MLTALELENFKAFGSRTRIEFAPITLIFGENSAGKSSILQALSLLKQTRESRDHGALLLPRTDGGIVDLGSFEELVFDHDPSRDLSIRVVIEPPQAGESFSNLDPEERIRWKTGFGFEMCLGRRENDNEVLLTHISLFLKGNARPALRFVPRELDDEERRSLRRGSALQRARRRPRISDTRAASCVEITEAPDLWLEHYHACKERSPQIVKAIQRFFSDVFGGKGANQTSLFEEENTLRDEFRAAEKFYGTDFTLEQFIDRMRRAALGSLVALDGFLPVQGRIDRAVEYPEFLAARPLLAWGQKRERFLVDVPYLMTAAGALVDDALESLFPLGPFRRPAERLYIFTGTTPQDVGYRGDMLPDLLFRRPELVNEANDWLQRLEMGYRISVCPVGTRSSDLFEVRLTDTRRTRPIDVAITDVGFGISQLLPFVVQTLASEQQIITIEQPEVHVHPRLQAALGDLLVAGIQAPRHHRFIVETHSEHLVLRLLRRIRETHDNDLPEGHPGLKPRDLSVIYIERVESGAKATRLRIDEAGEFIDRWPKGFFEERAEEIF